MYIRQECFLSFDEIIKFQPRTKLQLVLSQLDFNLLANKLKKPEHKRGPKGHDPLPILYSLIAMQLEKIKNTAALVQRLNSDPVFKYNCGFNILDKPPSKSAYSRFLNKIADTEYLEKEFRILVLKAKDLRIIDGSHVAIDSTEINAFEKSKPSSTRSLKMEYLPTGERRRTLMVMTINGLAGNSIYLLTVKVSFH